MNQVNGLTVVTDGADSAGAVVFWDLSGAVAETELRAAWKAAGLPEHCLPESPSPRRALHQACRQLAQARVLVRPLANNAGFSLVDETAQETRLSYQQGVIANINIIGAVTISPPDHPLASRILSGYRFALDHFTVDDISAALVRMTREIKAVALRPRGGFYFVPPSGIAQFKTAADTLAACGRYSCYSIPALRTEDTIRSVLDAIMREAADSARELEATFEDADTSARVFKTQSERCAVIEQKVSMYEELLGHSLEEVQQGLQDLRARLTFAAMNATKAVKQ